MLLGGSSLLSDLYVQLYSPTHVWLQQLPRLQVDWWGHNLGDPENKHTGRMKIPGVFPFPNPTPLSEHNHVSARKVSRWLEFFSLVLWEFCALCFNHIHPSPFLPDLPPLPYPHNFVSNPPPHQDQFVQPTYSCMCGLLEHDWLTRGSILTMDCPFTRS